MTTAQPLGQLAARGRELLANAAWGFRRVWATSPRLALSLMALTAVRGLLPATLALSVRGLVNSAVIAAETSGQLGPVLPWLGLAFVVTALNVVTILTRDLVTPLLRNEIGVDVGTQILEHAARLELSHFESSRQRDRMARARQAPGERLATLVLAALDSATQLVRVVSLVAILTVIEPLVLLVAILFAVPFLVFQWRLSARRYLEQRARATQLRWVSHYVSLVTDPRAAAEIKTLGLAPLLIESFRRLTSRFRDRDRSLHLRDYVGSSLAGVLTVSAFFALLLRVAQGAVAGSVSIGDLVVFAGAASRLRHDLEVGLRRLVAAYEQVLHTSDLRAFFQLEPASEETGSPIEVTGGGLEVRELVFTYPGADQPTLRGVDLVARPGEILAIVGENGAGKSTLTKLLARLYVPDGGQILLGGADLGALTGDELRRRTSFLFQSPVRYEATAAENIAYGDVARPPRDREAIERVAKASGVHETIRSMPQGYDTHLGREFGDHDPSGGEWQLIALARMLSREDAEMMVLDEPTSHLAPGAERRVLATLKRNLRGRTVVLTSHRLSTVAIADRIAVMEGGTVVETGTHQDLIGRGGAYSRLWAPLTVGETDAGWREGDG